MVAVSAPYQAQDVAAALAEQQVMVSPRSGSVRVAFHFYNNERDVRVALEALAATLWPEKEEGKEESASEIEA
jgi:selenocysteine lyase/cysteine desulfurase